MLELLEGIVACVGLELLSCWMSWDEVWVDGWESIYADTTWELFWQSIQ